MNTTNRQSTTITYRGAVTERKNLDTEIPRKFISRFSSLSKSIRPKTPPKVDIGDVVLKMMRKQRKGILIGS